MLVGWLKELFAVFNSELFVALLAIAVANYILNY